MSDTMLLLLVIGLVVAIVAAVILSMGRTFGRVLNPAKRIARMTDPVEGTLVVTAVPTMNVETIFQKGKLTGILTAEGIAAHAAQTEMVMKTDRWPVVGQTLPVVVDRARPSDWVVPWGRVGSSDEHALAEAERIAAVVRDDASRAAPDSPAR
ncbi:MAG TPA: hypothetical protein VJS15_04995 [Allosphingosinicella sp.]|nr:hypothetical protein [Allosphingosinicella sp.]